MSKNTNTWGGKRKGAGHPRNPYPLRIIKIACTEEEYQIILKLTTRQRTEILSRAIAKGEVKLTRPTGWKE